MGDQLDMFAPKQACVEMERGAVISPCQAYRYALWRRWGDPLGPMMAWAMLNPSIADASIDDPTICKCITLAKAWGFAGLRVVNLFAYRATDPKNLPADQRIAIGPDNDAELAGIDERYDLVVAAWGNHGSKWARDVAVLDILRSKHDVFCLRETKEGQPQHPLYMPNDSKPLLYRAKLMEAM